MPPATPFGSPIGPSPVPGVELDAEASDGVDVEAVAGVMVSGTTGGAVTAVRVGVVRGACCCAAGGLGAGGRGVPRAGGRLTGGTGRKRSISAGAFFGKLTDERVMTT